MASVTSTFSMCASSAVHAAIDPYIHSGDIGVFVQTNIVLG